MSSFSNMSAMLKYANEIGSTNKPPMFTNSIDYATWRSRFESFIYVNDPALWGPLVEKYERPTMDGTNKGIPQPKTFKQMTPEERKEYELDKKAFGFITMCLPKETLTYFKYHETAYDLWTAIEKRCGGNAQYKQSRMELLRKQFDLFDHLPNESFEDLMTRFSLLICEIKEGGEELDKLVVNKKLLSALPKKWEVRVMLLEDNGELANWSLDELIGKLQAYELDMKTKAAGKSQAQDPTLYHAKPNTGADPGIAFYSGEGSTDDYHLRTPVFGSSSSSYSQQSSSASSKHTEEHGAIFAAFISSYERLPASRPSNLNLVDEDFDQIHPDDLEEMDIEWSMAMLTRRAKKFLQRTGRARIGGHSQTGMGFDKNKVKCYNCQNYGHFARECEKRKEPASGFTKPSAPRGQEKESDKKSTSNALVSTTTGYDWTEHAADFNPFYNHNCAFLAEVDSDPFACISCQELTENIKLYQENNQRLIRENEKYSLANSHLKANEKVYEAKFKALSLEKEELKAKFYCQQAVIDSHMTEIAQLTKELGEAQSETVELKRKLSNFSSSAVVFDKILHDQQSHTKTKAGLGYHTVPPPKDFTPMPSQDVTKDYVPSSSNQPVQSDTLVNLNDPDGPILIEDITEEDVDEVDNLSVKPENFIHFTKSEEVLDKGKSKVEADNAILKTDSHKPENQKQFSKFAKEERKAAKALRRKERLVARQECASTSKTSESTYFKNKNFENSPNSIASTSSASSSGCTHCCACSNPSSCSGSTRSQSPMTSKSYSPRSQRESRSFREQQSCSRRPFNEPNRYYSRPQIEKRSCFYCWEHGHIIRDCKYLKKQEQRRSASPNSFQRKSYEKPFYRRNSSPPRPVKRDTRVVQNSDKHSEHNNSDTKVAKQQVWKMKSSTDDSVSCDNPSAEFMQNIKLADVTILDESGEFKSVKAWIPNNN